MNEKKKYKHFADDLEKVDDFFCFTKKDFLKEYPNITEIEYDLTEKELERTGWLQAE